MRIFENKSIFKKLIIVLLAIMIFSFCMPKTVRAEDSVGGKLLKPIVDLVLSVNDGIYNIVHKIILHQDRSLLPISLTDTLWEKISTILVFVVIAVIAAVAVIATAGAAAAIVAAISGITLSAVSVGTVIFVSVAAGTIGAAVYNANEFPNDKLDLPIYSISPEEIFSNSLVMFDVDFFNSEPTKILKDENGNKVLDEDGKVVELESTARKLKSTIADWYVILRDISLVALLSVLVYVGIKIVISSTSSEKAKYKQILIDWVVAICLLFVMQYIMSFSNLIVEKITNMLKNGVNYKNTTIQLIPDKDDKISEGLKEYGYSDNDIEDMFLKDENGNKQKIKDEENNKEYNLIVWNTNLIGIARLNAQMAQDKTATYAGYTIIFAVLIMMTVFFIFTYIKRIIYMAFLTLIAPLVAMTYPIDKMNDGKAQAFDSWFKEYIFNLLIQPMHLLLYTILVSSAFELATTNMLYSLVALGFMMPAEKLLRKFFGFEKAHTPGLLAGPAGAAATMGMVNKLLGKSPKGGKGKSSGNNGISANGGNEENTNIKYKEDMDSDSILYGEKNPDIEKIDTNMGQNVFSNENSKKGAYNNTTGEDINLLNSDVNIPIEDKIWNKGNQAGNYIGNEINDAKNTIGEYKEAFNRTQMGQGLNTIKYKVSNGKLGRTIKNSRVMAASKAGIKYHAKGMANKITTKVKNMHPIKGSIKTIGGLTAGATLASVGLAAGIASGDPTKAVQYTAGAALGGYKFGTGTVSSATSALSVDGTMEEMNKAYYGEERYKENQINKNIRNIQKDDNIKKELAKRLKNKENADEAMKTVVPDCVKYGLIEAKEYAAVYNRVKDGNDIKSAIAQVKEAKNFGTNTTKLGHKDREDYEKTIHDRIEKNNRGLSQEEKEKLQINILRNLDAASKDLNKKI